MQPARVGSIAAAAHAAHPSMDFVTFVLIYFGATACLIGLLLFGEAPMFAGTPIAKLHWLVTRGWMEALEWGVEKVFGSRGVKFLDEAATCCCERSNPTLQVCVRVVVFVGKSGVGAEAAVAWFEQQHPDQQVKTEDKGLQRKQAQPPFLPGRFDSKLSAGSCCVLNKQCT